MRIAVIPWSGCCNLQVAADCNVTVSLQVQLFFSDEIPGFANMHSRHGSTFADSAGGDAGGSLGGSAMKQDADDKHARFQASTRREHLGERAVNSTGVCHLAPHMGIACQCSHLLHCPACLLCSASFTFVFSTVSSTPATVLV